MKTLREHFEAWQAELGGPPEMRTLAASAFLVGVSSVLAARDKGQNDLEITIDMVKILSDVEDEFAADQRAIAERN